MFQRRILPKPMRVSKHRPLKQKRPRSRTLTAVHDSWLDEMVFPAEVVGRRIRVKLDGKRVHKVGEYPIYCFWHLGVILPFPRLVGGFL